MAKYKNDKGEEVEAFSQEELDAKIKEAMDAAAKVAEDAAATKKAEEDAAAAAAADTQTEEQKRITALENDLRASRMAGYATRFAGNDPDKTKAYESAFSRITGFDDTPEGREDHAKAAARMAFGSDAGVDVASISHTGGGRNPDAMDPKAPESEASKAVAKSLGITEEDKKMYGPGGTKNPDTAAS